MANEQLIAYIKSQLAAQVPMAEIHRALTAQGWPAQDISQAFASAAPPTPPTPPSGPIPPHTATTASTTFPQSGGHKNILITAIVTLLLVAGAVVAFAAPSVRSFIFSTFSVSTTSPQTEGDAITQDTQPTANATGGTPASVSEACAVLFPGGVREDTYSPPPAIVSGATDASTNGRVSAVQFILGQDEDSEVQMTGVFDSATQRAMAQAEAGATSANEMFKDPQTKQPIPLDPSGTLGAHGFRLLHVSCLFFEAAAAYKKKAESRPATMQFTVPGEVTLRVGETAATVDGAYKITVNSFEIDDDKPPLTELGLTVVAGKEPYTTRYGWVGQATPKPTIWKDIKLEFIKAVGIGQDTKVTISVSKVIQ